MRYPRAQWVGADPHNFSTESIRPKFIVIHVEQGSESGTDGWFHNPKAQVSAHLGNPKSGPMQQFVDLNQMAYHCAQMNYEAIGIEHEGFSGEHLNANQIKNLTDFFTWSKTWLHIPLVLTNPSDLRGGVIAHGQINEGALSHPNCPGQNIMADVNKILHGMSTPHHHVLPPSHVIQQGPIA